MFSVCIIISDRYDGCQLPRTKSTEKWRFLIWMKRVPECRYGESRVVMPVLQDMLRLVAFMFITFEQREIIEREQFGNWVAVSS